MIVKILTHVHLLVHTLWCWHTLRRRWSLKSRERVGSSLPPAELARRDSALLRKWSAYFLLRRWESWTSHGSVPHWETLTGRWPLRHRTQRLCVRCAVVLGLSTGRWTPDARELLFMRSVLSDFYEWSCLEAPDAKGASWKPKFGFGN